MGHPQQHGALLPKRIILVHHGESEGNLSPSGQATTPDHKIPLTPLGVAQARAAGDRLRTLVAGGGEWRVYFYASPYKQTQSMLREIGRSFRRGWVIGAREECRIREQDFWSSQVVGRMKVVKEARERFGRFFYRFPEGE